MIDAMIFPLSPRELRDAQIDKDALPCAQTWKHDTQGTYALAEAAREQYTTPAQKNQ